MVNPHRNNQNLQPISKLQHSEIRNGHHCPDKQHRHSKEFLVQTIPTQNNCPPQNSCDEWQRWNTQPEKNNERFLIEQSIQTTIFRRQHSPPTNNTTRNLPNNFTISNYKLSKASNLQWECFGLTDTLQPAKWISRLNWHGPTTQISPQTVAGDTRSHRK